MYRVILEVGYEASEFEFQTIEDAMRFADTALTTHVREDGCEELEVRFTQKKCAGSGNSEVAHNK